MDPRRFDTLARSLAAPKTRRGLFGSLAALGAGVLGARATDAQVSQTRCGNKTCASDPGVCNDGCVCCVTYHRVTGQPANSRCLPAGSCGPATPVCPSGLVYDPVQGCVECVASSDCELGLVCRNNVCRGCQSSLECTFASNGQRGCRVPDGETEARCFAAGFCDCPGTCDQCGAKTCFDTGGGICEGKRLCCSLIPGN